MSLSDLASIGSFVSGFAVLASLIFVGFQLRQNTQAVKAGASQAQAANYSQIVAPLSENSDLVRIYRIGLQDFGSLTDDERVRFVAFWAGLFRFYESARVQWLHGQLDREHWQSVERNIIAILGQPGVMAYWRMRRHLHSDEFQTWFNSLPRTSTNQDMYETQFASTPIGRASEKSV